MAPSDSSRLYLPAEHVVASQARGGVGAYPGGKGNHNSLAAVSNQKSSMASLNASAGGRSAVNYDNFRLHKHSFSKERKGNKISLTGGLSS